MKLAISGKGGVGKSTIAGTLALLYAAEGNRVLAIDADPDANLASALGVPPELRAQVRTISTERKLVEERTGAKANEFGQIFRLNPDVSGIAERYAIHHRGVDLLVLGAVQRAAGGCACPESVLLKNLVLHLTMKRGEVVILDMEAGIEHLGRGTAMGVDLMLVVVEPGRRSIETAERIRAMSAALGIRRFAVVLNKSIEDADRESAAEFGADLAGVIPFDPRVIGADRRGLSILDLASEELATPYRTLKANLDSRIKETLK